MLNNPKALDCEVNVAEPMLASPSSSVQRRINLPTPESEGAERREAPPASSLPCLSSNNCTIEKVDTTNVLTGGHKRTALVVSLEVQSLARHYGIDRLGFFTLTFREHITDLKEAQRRFHSLRSHVISKRYERAIAVMERHRSGRIHFHLVVVVKHDIRSGADFSAFRRKDYWSANTALRAEWSFWRSTCPKYGFGRHELMPVKSNAEGIARYVGKYISKHVTQRLKEDKGARLVRFIGYKRGDRAASSRFSWNSGNGWLWRQKLGAYAKRVGAADLNALRRVYGPRWAYYLKEEILAESLDGVVYPSFPVAQRSLVMGDRILVACYRAREVIENLPVNRTILLESKKLYSRIIKLPHDFF